MLAPERIRTETVQAEFLLIILNSASLGILVFSETNSSTRSEERTRGAQCARRADARGSVRSPRNCCIASNVVVNRLVMIYENLRNLRTSAPRSPRELIIQRRDRNVN